MNITKCDKCSKKKDGSLSFLNKGGWVKVSVFADKPLSLDLCEECSKELISHLESYHKNGKKEAKVA